MYKRILIPTDGSQASERAIVAGVEFARNVGAEVFVMTALPEFHAITANTEMLEQTRDQYDAASKAHGQRLLEELAAQARAAGVPCTTVLAVSDDPHEAIISTARENRCDLIIMASHGHKGIKSLLLGSETQKVLVHSAIPVLVYR